VRSAKRAQKMTDVAIVGGGIVGVAAAAFLARTGARVELFERGELAGAASGRNSGAVQHPLDPVLVPLYRETLELYRDVLGLGDEPAGVLMLARDAGALGAGAGQLRAAFPELEPELVDAPPYLAPGVAACRLRTGHPVVPAAATLALAALAREHGAVLRTDAVAELWRDGDAVRGVVVEGERRPAGAVLVAAGPWTPAVVDPSGGWRPIRAVWGVNVEVALDDPPAAIVEEAGVEAAVEGTAAPLLFSLVSAGGRSALGSTFLDVEPDADGLSDQLVRSGAAFVPAVAEARVVGARACARPQSLDGRPLVGPLPSVDGLHVAAGHGPWGISTGPATARMAADAILQRGSAIPAELAAERTCGA
jgi:glycine/D-amino acid oxidase-like deaminating enzyme